MAEQKQQIFQELYKKFVRKCLQENILPTVALKYDVTGIFPQLNFIEVDEKQKAELLSSLDK